MGCSDPPLRSVFSSRFSVATGFFSTGHRECSPVPRRLSRARRESAAPTGRMQTCLRRRHRRHSSLSCSHPPRRAPLLPLPLRRTARAGVFRLATSVHRKAAWPRLGWHLCNRPLHTRGSKTNAARPSDADGVVQPGRTSAESREQQATAARGHSGGTQHPTSVRVRAGGVGVPGVFTDRKSVQVAANIMLKGGRVRLVDCTLHLTAGHADSSKFGDVPF